MKKMTTNTPKWQIALKEQWEHAPLKELLDECLSLAGGDGYDGGFTPHGWNEYQFLVTLLKERMKKETLS